MRLVDVRHEQTAVFAAEATARLTRSPGFAVVTAGPGVTNAVSAITTAHFNGSPVVVLGGRAPDYRWGVGQPAGDRPPAAAGAGHQAGLDRAPGGERRRRGGRGVPAGRRPAPGPGVPRHRAGGAVRRRRARAAGRGARPAPAAGRRGRPGPGRRGGDRRAARGREPARCWCSAPTSGSAAPRRPPRQAAAELRLPVIANGQGRGILPAGHDLLVTRARSVAFAEADLVVVAGHAAGLPARLRRVRRAGRQPARPGGARGRQPGPARHPRHARRVRRRRPVRLLHRAGQRGARGAAPGGRRGPALGGHLAPAPRGRRPRRRWPPTRPCWPATPTRSTRCASTANSPGCSTTTPW